MAYQVVPSMDQFKSEVRDFIRDFPELNRLVSGEETSDRMIEYCACMAIDEWNTTPPLSNNGISDFPSRFILMNLTICHILTSVGILKSRNRFQYSDGGFSVETEGQDDRYVRWIQLIRSQVNPLIRNYKVAKNISEGYGASLGSEYGWIHGWYGLT